VSAVMLKLSLNIMKIMWVTTVSTEAQLRTDKPNKTHCNIYTAQAVQL
jgi:hypothetical protein